MSRIHLDMRMNIRIRPATMNDIPILREVIEASVRGLQAEDYSPAQIEGALQSVYGVDSQLISDGTYLVAEAVESHHGKLQNKSTIIGCGGWSKRKTLFGGDQYATRDATYLDPETEPAKIRAFFIHPEHARKGIARAILAACEAEAKAAGFKSLELMSTLPGIKLYRACGYEAEERVELEVGGGVTIGLVPMRKNLR